MKFAKPVKKKTLTVFFQNILEVAELGELLELGLKLLGELLELGLKLLELGVTSVCDSSCDPRELASPLENPEFEPI